MKAPEPKFTPRKLIPEGTYMARIYSIVGLGTHETEWKGKSMDQEKVRITWELPTELLEYEKDGEKKTGPSVVGKEYTFSMGEKANLRKVVENMLGTTLQDNEAYNFDLFTLIGMPCMLQISHKAKKDGSGKYININSISTPLKGISVPPQVNPSVKFDIHIWNQEVFDTLPKFMQEKIEESHERAQQPSKKDRDLDSGVSIQYPDEDINPEDIPF